MLLVYSQISLATTEIPRYLQVLGQGKVIVSHEDISGYELDKTMLRQEALGVAIKATRKSAQGSCTSSFSDVSTSVPNDWICPLASFAVKEGRVSSANTRFRPEDSLSRAEALGMLVYPQCGTTTYEYDALKYVFDQDLQDWQKKTIVLALHAGIIPEITGTDWNGAVSREEFFWWAYQVYSKQIISCFWHKSITYYYDYGSYAKSIRVDTSREKLSFYEYGQKIGSFTVSTGNNDNATPSGRFRITNKDPKMLSSSAGLWMPYWMEFYNGEYGFHALPVTYSGTPVRDDSSLGRSAPGGCVRLSEKDAKTLYEWADTDTVVLIHYNDSYQP